MKTIHIKVIPNARKNEIIEEDGKLKIKVNSPAVDGKANKAVLKALADYLNVKPRQLEIIKGEKSREKEVRVIE